MTGSDRPADSGRDRETLPSASIIIPSYTLDRWPLLLAAVTSAQHQTVAPQEVIICIDHNDALLERTRQEFSGPASVPVIVMPNVYAGHQGSARTTAAERAQGEILVFLDDDARAESSWLERLLNPYRDPDVVAVGAAPLPEYASKRPSWFPAEFDWVFGCAYVGLPTQLGPTLRLIGTSMSVRREALLEINGFHSDAHDDMDVCHRLADRWPGKQILYEPAAVVRHHVPPERLTWSYFWRRCFFVNRGKAVAHRDIGSSDNLAADRRFVAKALGEGTLREAKRLAHGDLTSLLRILSLYAGVALAGSGYLLGMMDLLRRSRRHAVIRDRARPH